MQSIGNILHYDFNSPHKEISAIAKQTEALNIWPRVFSKYCPENGERSMAVSLKGGVLTVAALDDSTADAIQFCRERLMQEMNTQLKSHTVWWIACEK